MLGKDFFMILEYIMQTAILVIICVHFCFHIYVVFKWASNTRRYSKERDEIYKLEKQIWEEYRAEMLFRIKHIQETQWMILHKAKRKDRK